MTALGATGDALRRLTRTASSVQRRSGHLTTLAWFLRDAYRVSPMWTLVALASEFGAYVLQGLAYGLLASAISNPDAVLEQWSRERAAAALGATVVVALLCAEVLKYGRQALKNRVAYRYEVDALRRVLRYSTGANRFDSETIKNVASRLPQVSARVAMTAIETVVPIIVIVIAGGLLAWQYPVFCLILLVGLIVVFPVYFLVVRRGRSATSQFYSVDGLNYARSAALAFTPGRGGIPLRDVLEIPRNSEASLKALEIRRSTPNLTYLVTGAVTAVTLGGLVVYAVARDESAASGSLLHLLVILQFVYMGLGRLTSAVSKSQILLPRIESVMWAIRGESPPPVGGTNASTGPAEFEDLFDDT